jgi:2-haloacid dehalogenase
LLIVIRTSAHPVLNTTATLGGARGPYDAGVTARAVLLDLLMATMDSISVWALAAGDRDRGLAWRDLVTERMIAAGRYTPYESLVAEAAPDVRLPLNAPRLLHAAWANMRPWPDTDALQSLRLPFAFATNCSATLAAAAAERSGLRPRFTLSAEEAGWYKPRPEIYHLACERIEAAPEHVWFIAGAPYDAVGAAAAGLHSILVTRRPLKARLPAAIDTVTSLRDAIDRLDPRSTRRVEC